MTLRMKSDVTMQERLKDFDPDGALRQHAREIFELLKEDIHHLPATFWNNVLERSGLKYRMSPTQIDEAIQRSQEYVRAKYSNFGDESWADIARGYRSEEHTSELQSLMRISYAVFCLKKQHQQTTKH